MLAIIILLNAWLGPATERQSVEIIKILFVIVMCVPQGNMCEILTIICRAKYLLPHIVTRVYPWLTSVLRDSIHQILQVLAVWCIWVVSPAAPRRRICLKVDPHHPIVLPFKPIDGPLGLISSRFPPAWEQVYINIRYPCLSGYFDAWDGICVESTVGVPCADDCEGYSMGLQALQVWQGESVSVVYAHSRLG